MSFIFRPHHTTRSPKPVSRVPLSLGLTFAVSLALSVTLSGCAAVNSEMSDSTLSATGTSTSAISSTPLLDKDARTILNQSIAYPTALPAQISSSIISIPPGVETGLHKHEAPMYAYIIEGDLTVTYDGDVVKTYHPGEAIMEAIGTAHNGKNNGTKTVQVLVVNMGAEGVENTVKLP